MKPQDMIECGLLAIIVVGICLWLTGCGSTMRLEYGQPDGKALAFELKLPTKYSK